MKGKEAKHGLKPGNLDWASGALGSYSGSLFYLALGAFLASVSSSGNWDSWYTWKILNQDSMGILGQEVGLRVFINIQKFLAKFCVWGYVSKRRSRALNPFAESCNSKTINNCLFRWNLWFLPGLTFNSSNNNIEKWENDNLCDKEKRNYSVKTRNRHVRSCPDYQFFGSWLVGTLPGMGTPGAAGSLSTSHQCWSRSQSPILLFPSLGRVRWGWQEGLALGFELRVWVQVALLWVALAIIFLYHSLDSDRLESEIRDTWTMGWRSPLHLPQYRKGLQNHWGVNIRWQGESWAVQCHFQSFRNSEMTFHISGVSLEPGLPKFLNRSAFIAGERSHPPTANRSYSTYFL